MQTFKIDKSQQGKKIERVLREKYTNIPANTIFKAFRKKDIRVNGIRVKEDFIVSINDDIEVYIVDDILNGDFKRDVSKPCEDAFKVVYEDKNILLVNKKQGIPVHPNKEETTDTLIDLVQKYLKSSEAFSYYTSSTFQPALCHRIDRNTGGLVLFAKNPETLEVLQRKIKDNEVQKYYVCYVKGKMPKEKDELKAFLFKDEKKSRVYITNEKSKGSLEIITKYKVLSYENDISLLEIELVTGRTHQIRAHMAFIGNPIIGDGKYGSNAVNKMYNIKYQCLWAYKLKFSFKSDAGILQYLNERTLKFNVEDEILSLPANKLMI